MNITAGLGANIVKLIQQLLQDVQEIGFCNTGALYMLFASPGLL